jgi:hypothetical protein
MCRYRGGDDQVDAGWPDIVALLHSSGAEWFAIIQEQYFVFSRRAEGSMAGRRRTKARAVVELHRDFGKLAQRFTDLMPAWVDTPAGERFRYSHLWREIRCALWLGGLHLSTLALLLGEDCGLDESETRSDAFEAFSRKFMASHDFEALGDLDLLNPPDPYPDDGFYLDDDDLELSVDGGGGDPELIPDEPVGAGVSGDGLLADVSDGAVATA